MPYRTKQFSGTLTVGMGRLTSPIPTSQSPKRWARIECKWARCKFGAERKRWKPENVLAAPNWGPNGHRFNYNGRSIENPLRINYAWLFISTRVEVEAQTFFVLVVNGCDARKIVCNCIDNNICLLILDSAWPQFYYTIKTQSHLQIASSDVAMVLLYSRLEEIHVSLGRKNW